MVDVMGLLDSLKGKALDLKHIDLLKHAYELQQQNVEQLRTNNDALKESNELLREKVEALKAQVQDWMGRAESADKRATDAEAAAPKATARLEEKPEAVIQALAGLGGASANNRVLAQKLGLHQTECDHYIDTLENANYVYKIYHNSVQGSSVFLAEAGREYAVKNGLLRK